MKAAPMSRTNAMPGQQWATARGPGLRLMGIAEGGPLAAARDEHRPRDAPSRRTRGRHTPAGTRRQALPLLRNGARETPRARARACTRALTQDRCTAARATCTAAPAGYRIHRRSAACLVGRPPGSLGLERDLDVAPSGVRIRADLMCSLGQRLNHARVDPRDGDPQRDRQSVRSAANGADRDVRFDG